MPEQPVSVIRAVTQFDDPGRDVSLATPTCGGCCCCCCCLITAATVSTLTAVHLRETAARHGAAPGTRALVATGGALGLPAAYLVGGAFGALVAALGLRLLGLPLVIAGSWFAALWLLYAKAGRRGSEHPWQPALLIVGIALPSLIAEFCLLLFVVLRPRDGAFRGNSSLVLAEFLAIPLAIGSGRLLRNRMRRTGRGRP